MRQRARVQMQVGFSCGATGQRACKSARGDKAARQLIRAEQHIGQRQTRISGQHMSMQLRLQLGQTCCGNRTRRDVVTRPRQYRQRNQQLGLPGTVEQTLAAAFDGLRQLVVGRWIG